MPVCGESFVVPEKYRKGQRFLKWSGKKSDPSVGPGYSCLLCIDPHAHILYWFREFGTSKSKVGDRVYRYLSDVVDVRKGKHAIVYQSERFNKSADLIDCLMTVVTNVDFVNPEFLTFMTSRDKSDQVRDWSEFIFSMAQRNRKQQRGVMYYVQKRFAPLRYANSKGTVSIDQMVRAFVPSESNVTDSAKVSQAIRSVFPGRSTVKCAELTDDRLFEMYVAVTGRHEIVQIFRRRTRDRSTGKLTGKMDVRRILRFLNVVQRDPRQNEEIFPEETVETVIAILRKLAPQRDHFNEQGFIKYLLSDENVEITNHSLRYSEENMHEPLSCYYINSSHNSYLIGAQIWHARYFCSNQSCSADVEIYRQILLSGCRCVELDCWDGSDGEPIITHGPTEITFIQPVQLKSVCEAIAESAFKASQFPVCLSIENHCSPIQQQRMAQIFVETFGEFLLSEPLSDHPLEPGILLPSPYKLRKKILIKGRKKSRPAKDTGSVSFQNSKESTGTEVTLLDVAEIAAKTASVRVGEGEATLGALTEMQILERNSRALHEMAKLIDTPKKGNNAEEEAEIAMDEEQKKQLTATEVDKYATELSNLVNYLEARPSSGLKIKQEGNHRYNRIYSIAEKKALETVMNFHSQLAKHNVRQLTRVYPDGSRFSSTNYLPMFGWMVGIQMMALNFQTNGTAMQMNGTLFEENGSCGFVLKPRVLRDASANINVFGDIFHSTVLQERLEIKVLSGQLFDILCPQKSSVSTYVQVDFYGLPLEQIKGRFKTSTAFNNGINPSFGTLKDEPFVIENIRFPERSVLHIRVMNDKGEQLAQRILPVHLLTNGYRHIILRNAANRPVGPASVFVKIKVGYDVQPAHIALVDAFADPLKSEIEHEKKKLNFEDPLGFQAEEELIETDEMESDKDIFDGRKTSSPGESSKGPLDTFRKISKIFNRSA